MSSILFNESSICIINANIPQIIPLAIFLLSLIFFKFLFANKLDESQKQIKIEKAKKYLDMYTKENEEFFFGVRDS